METVQQQPMLAAGVTMTQKQQQQMPQPKPQQTKTIQAKPQQQENTKKAMKAPFGALMNTNKRKATQQINKTRRVTTDIDKPINKSVVPPMRNAFGIPIAPTLPALPTIRDRTDSNIFSDETTITIHEESGDETCGTDPIIRDEINNKTKREED